MIHFFHQPDWIWSRLFFRLWFIDFSVQVHWHWQGLTDVYCCGWGFRSWICCEDLSKSYKEREREKREIGYTQEDLCLQTLQTWKGSEHLHWCSIYDPCKLKIGWWKVKTWPFVLWLLQNSFGPESLHSLLWGGCWNAQQSLTKILEKSVMNMIWLLFRVFDWSKHNDLVLVVLLFGSLHPICSLNFSFMGGKCRNTVVDLQNKSVINWTWPQLSISDWSRWFAISGSHVYAVRVTVLLVGLPKKKRLYLDI